MLYFPRRGAVAKAMFPYIYDHRGKYCVKSMLQADTLRLKLGSSVLCGRKESTKSLHRQNDCISNFWHRIYSIFPLSPQRRAILKLPKSAEPKPRKRQLTESTRLKQSRKCTTAKDSSYQPTAVSSHWVAPRKPSHTGPTNDHASMKIPESSI